MRPRGEGLNTLRHILSGLGSSAIAVSGGIDSLTLAVVACEREPGSLICHAVSPAVPQSATARVKDYAERYDWNLKIFDAGEFGDPSYRQNPVNRCFFCKGNLYSAIAKMTVLPILSGTNLDDLSDFRPGLSAAKDFAVCHPYIDAEIDKAGIRTIAKQLGLKDIAEMPSAPCLSSRVRTGIVIDPTDLQIIDDIETAIQTLLGPVNARCRRTRAGFHIEIDAHVLEQMDQAISSRISAIALGRIRPTDSLGAMRPYQMGSAFIKEGTGHG